MIFLFLATAFPSPAGSMHGDSDTEVDGNVTLAAPVDTSLSADANPNSPFCPASPISFPHLPPTILKTSDLNGNLCYDFLNETTS